MKWKVMVMPVVLTRLANLKNNRAQKRLAVTIEDLVESPDLKGKPLHGSLKGFRSLRAAAKRYRVVYRVDEKKQTVSVVYVGKREQGSRDDVYELFKRLVKLHLLD